MAIKPFSKMWGKISDKEVVYVPLSKIVRSPFQPRKNFDEEELLELAQSIRAYGVIQPVILRKEGDVYQLVAGERRYRACLLLGLSEIPALIQNMDDEKAAAVALIENLQRKELNFFEEAYAYNILVDVFGLTQEEVARKVGKSQSAVANKLRLLKLPLEVQNKLVNANLTERHARVLLKINSPQMQLDIIEKICEKELNVKETEELVEKLSQNNLPPEEKRSKNEPNVSMIVRDARIFLNTIKETVKRAKQTGIDICMEEIDGEETYELVIKLAKKRNSRQLMSS